MAAKKKHIENEESMKSDNESNQSHHEQKSGHDQEGNHIHEHSGKHIHDRSGNHIHDQNCNHSHEHSESPENKQPHKNRGIVESGSTVTLDYTGTLEDGTVFDSSVNHNEPLKFELGKGMVIKGFENSVMGMKVGQEKTFSLEPGEAYGERHTQLIQKIPRNKAMEQQEPKPGMYLVVNAPDGQQYPALIADVSETELSLDFNHPLAGKKLTFKIKIVKIE